jgi:tetratricopeptide (TPR) repeat protein
MTGGYVLDWPEARRRKSANAQARWDSVIGEFDAEVWPELQPSFTIRPGEVVFTIGSCFARNIEANLGALGCKVPMLSLSFPTEELSGQPRSAMNRFHPPAFRQCLEWTARIHDRDGIVTWADCESMAIRSSGPPQETFFDMDMAGAIPVSQARFIERRQHIYDIFSTVFSAACMMMTPGVVEAFKDLETGLYIYGAPTNRAMLSQPGRWRFEALSFERCQEDMLAAIDVVRARNPDIKILVTTSPVPLGVTFSGRDVRIANTYSKSVLRAVCDVVAMSRPMVDYFPSYETVTLSNPAIAWNADRLHPTQALIGKIVARMTDTYLQGVTPEARRYHAALSSLNESDYAAAAAEARALVELDPDRLDARSALVEALIGLQAWEEAEPAALALIEQAPTRPEPRFRLALILGAQGRREEAMAALGDAVDLPGVSQADAERVGKLIARSPPDAALPIARRLAERFPQQVEVHIPLVQLLVASERHDDEALAAARRALGLPKAPKMLRHLLAKVLVRSGDAAAARQEIDGLLASDPGDAYALKLKQKLDRQRPAGVA